MKILKKLIKKRKEKAEEKKKAKELEELQNSIAYCGSNLQLFSQPEIYFHSKLKIGNDCKINSSVYINARSGVTIGDDVTLSHGTKIISTGYNIDHWINTGKKLHMEDSPIHIGNHCWIGANAIILPGVKITGEYVVIGAGAVVTKDVVESNVLIAGNPAKILKHYDKNYQE